MRVGLLFNKVYLVGWVCVHIATANTKVAMRKPICLMTVLWINIQTLFMYPICGTS